MTQAHRRYLATEMTVSAAINAVLSIAFVVLLFRGLARVTTPALIGDALPQSFMIALMASLVPSLLTLRRLRAGTVAALPGGGRRPNVVLRSLLTAAAVAMLAWVVHWTLLPLLLPSGAAFATVLVAKAVYGGLLGSAVTRFAVQRVLASGGPAADDR